MLLRPGRSHSNKARSAPVLGRSSVEHPTGCGSSYACSRTDVAATGTVALQQSPECARPRAQQRRTSNGLRNFLRLQPYGCCCDRDGRTPTKPGVRPSSGAAGVEQPTGCRISDACSPADVAATETVALQQSPECARPRAQQASNIQRAEEFPTPA